MGAWGGHAAVATDEGLRVRIAADAPDWSGAAAELVTPLMLAAGEAKRGGFVWPGTSVESGVWRTVRIPLRRLVPADAETLTRLAIQFRPFGSARADYRFRALRIE